MTGIDRVDVREERVPRKDDRDVGGDVERRLRGLVPKDGGIEGHPRSLDVALGAFMRTFGAFMQKLRVFMQKLGAFMQELGALSRDLLGLGRLDDRLSCEHGGAARLGARLDGTFGLDLEQRPADFGVLLGFVHRFGLFVAIEAPEVTVEAGSDPVDGLFVTVEAGADPVDGPFVTVEAPEVTVERSRCAAGLGERSARS